MSTISESLTLAVEHHQAGRLQHAERLYQEVLRADPNQADALHLMGVMAHQTGKHEIAVEQIRRAIALNPQTAVFHSNLGAAYEALGRLSEAVVSYKQALEIMPGYAEAHNNLGNALRQQGRLDEAVASYQSALRVNPDDAKAYNNMGIALQQQGKPDEAIACYQRAVQIDPQHAKAHNNLGVALEHQERFDEAAACYERALEIDPDYAEAHNNLGTVLLHQLKVEESLESYERALEIMPDYPEALANLAGLYERLNRLPEARSTLAKGLRVAPDHPHVNVVAAKCEEREGCYQEAIKRLEAVRPLVEPSAGVGDIASEISFQLGRLYDRTGDARRAFAELSEANRTARERVGDWAARKERYLQNIDVLKHTFSEAWVDSWSPIPPSDEQQTPVFVIGFPRSGRTLIDVILDSHRRIQTLEEKPAVWAIRQGIEGLPCGYPRAMVDLVPAQIEWLRAAYFRAVDEFIERRPGHRLVDKFPMNAVHAGLILRVFPTAKFIMVLRHPCDVCLSCFMQDFKINDAMANFFSIEDAAVLYAKVMSLWQQYRRVLPHSCHVVRYEDLVDDFEGETRRLLEFLGLEWDDAVLDYAGHAAARGRISTPSYDQVTEPIYRRARYRWRRYAEQLQPVMGLLEPFIEYFGYGNSEAG